MKACTHTYAGNMLTNIRVHESMYTHLRRQYAYKRTCEHPTKVQAHTYAYTYEETSTRAPDGCRTQPPCCTAGSCGGNNQKESGTGCAAWAEPSRLRG